MIRELSPQTVTSRGGRSQRITLAHGGGGQLTEELIQTAILPHVGNTILNELLDAGVLQSGGHRLVFTIDGYVVQPLSFPGGDIGKLAVCGTINDLVVMGAKPLALALGLILEEGLDRAVLNEVLESIASVSRSTGVPVVTGDTKVVARGQADGIFITTAGIGAVSRILRVHPSHIGAGDAILINGPIADHGLAIMLARQMPDVQSAVRSDVKPLNGLVEKVLKQVPDIVFMRDPTRGGLSGLCADVAQRTGWRIRLDEQEIPIRPETHHAAEMLGIDPLEVANEGKVVLFVRPESVERALAMMKNHPDGRDARVIGKVEDLRDGLCVLATRLGGQRIIQKPYGEQLPRIC